jgi:hypothetical protein
MRRGPRRVASALAIAGVIGVSLSFLLQPPGCHAENGVGSRARVRPPTFFMASMNISEAPFNRVH